MIILKCFCIGGLFLSLTGAMHAYAASDAVRDSGSVHTVHADTSALHPAPLHPIPLTDADTASLHAITVAGEVLNPPAAVDRPHFFRNLQDDFLIQASSPFRMNAKQAMYAGAGLGITFGLIELDGAIDRNIRDLDANHKVIRGMSPILTEFGGTNGILTVVAYAGYSVIWNDEEAQQTSMLLAQAVITSGVWSRLGKLLSGRERPSAAYEYSHLPGGRWHGLAGSLRKHSSETVAKYDAFPSGHTTTAFAIATVFAKRYSESRYVPIIAYSLATLVGLTRMIEHTHWASDVFAGACLGYLCADQVVAHDEDLHDQDLSEAGRRKPVVRFSLGMLNESPALQLAVGF